MRNRWRLLLVPLALCAASVAAGWSPGGRRVEALVRALRSGGPRERATAARLLGESGAREAVGALCEALLHDPSPLVRAETARALGRLRDRRATEALSKALLEDRDVNVRMLSAYALGLIGDERAVPALCRALEDREWLVREFAAWALREIGHPGAIRPLVQLLRGRDADIAHIVWVLERLKRPEAVDLLLPLLKEREAEVRRRAALVLGKLGDVRAVDALISALGDESPSVRREAILALVRIGDLKAVSPLKELLRREKEEEVREAAREALHKLKFERIGLVAYWSFDEVEEGTVKDVTGNGNDGKLMGGRQVEGKVGKALEFSGKGQYVLVSEVGAPPAVRIGGRPFTVMAWVFPKAEEGVVVAYGGAWAGFSLYIKDGLPKFGISRGKDVPDDIISGKERVVGRWVHLAGVVRKGRMELFVDGKLVAQKPIPGFVGEPGQGMQIGFDLGNSPAETTAQFIGIIDEVKFFEKALSPEEIAQQAGLSKR